MKILDNRIEFTGLVEELPWGNIHLGRDTELARQLTIVEVNRHVFAKDQEVRTYVRAAYGLTQISHPNIQQALGVKRGEDGTPYIVLEHTGGARLRKLLDSQPAFDLPIEECYYIAGQIARALAATHDARDRQTAQPLKLYHLSLNPGTIWVTDAGTVRLTNFQYPPAQIKEAEQVAYLAPEQIQGGSLDQRADIFSLGLIAYELFTGRRYFGSNNVSEIMAAELKGEYQFDALRSSKADQRITELVEVCIRLNRNDRMVTATQFADRAEALVREAGIRPEKRVRELVEKLSEIPKLQTYPTGRSERVRTRAVDRTDFEEGTQSMADQSRNDRDDDKRPRAGQETRISSTPVSERLKRAKRSGFGGNKTVLALGSIAALLILVVGFLVVRKMMQGAGGGAESEVIEMESGTISTIPDGVAVYSADSLLGYTPLTITMAEGELLTMKHPCCPDSAIVLNFDRLSEGPYEMKTVVEITSNPVGAKLTLNGQDIGKTTPHQFSASASDTIQFTLEMPGKKVLNSGAVVLADYASLNLGDITAERSATGGIEFSGSFSERPMTSIITYPRDATVSIAGSGVELGRSPLKKDLGDDAVMLTITKAGYEDRILEIPAIGKRRETYKEYLFRRVDVQAYESGHPDQTVNARIAEIVYDGKSYASSEITPASVRLPGIDCRIVLTADGYQDADTIVTPFAKEFTVVMRKRESGRPATPDITTKPSNAAKSEVKIFVVDDKKSPVSGVLVTAEFKVGKEKQIADVGRTDADGRVVAMLDPNKYKFITSHENYKNSDESKEVKAGEQYVLTIKVKRR
ncbi:MAG: protein kinase [Candidatus Zixiibacteriota bacterium]